MAYKPKAPAVMAAPNVIPMADIMLVLLIIFMVVTPMLQKGVSVDMAKADNARELRWRATESCTSALRRSNWAISPPA